MMVHILYTESEIDIGDMKTTGDSYPPISLLGKAGTNRKFWFSIQVKTISRKYSLFLKCMITWHLKP